MKFRILILIVFWGVASTALRANSPLKESDIVLPKTSVDILKKGFSMTPPKGYEQVKENLGVTLFFQVPKSSLGSNEYQRTIQVRHNTQVINVDQFEMDRFGERLVQMRSSALGGASGYELVSSEIVKTGEGQDGILYYARFMLDELEMMEMHFLVGGELGHYLLTFTDVEANFERADEGTPLYIAYQSMMSIKVFQQSAGRFDYVVPVVGGVAAVFLLWVLFRFVQGRSQVRLKRNPVLSPDEPMSGIEYPIVSEHLSDHDEVSSLSQEPIRKASVVSKLQPKVPPPVQVQSEITEEPYESYQSDLSDIPQTGDEFDLLEDIDRAS